MPFIFDLYTFFATLSLAVQLTVLSLLLYGYWLKRHQNFVGHARTMTVALALHLLTIFAFMIPAFVLAIVPVFILRNISDVTSLVALVHVPLGAVAVSLGLFRVISWRRFGLKKCLGKGRYMLATMTIWVTALSFGIAFYIILYWQTLMG